MSTSAQMRSPFRPWTDEEHGFIADTMDWPRAEVAEHLGRTIVAVAGRRSLLLSGKLAGRKDFPQPWTRSEDFVILENPRMSLDDLSALLGRKRSGVDARRKKLRRAANPCASGWRDPLKPGARPLLARTCPDCGLLLQAKWFSKNNVNVRSTFCNSCRGKRSDRQSNTFSHRRRTRDLQLKYQAITIPTAVRHNQPWIEADYQVLADPDMSVLQKAIKLGRTYATTANRCSTMGFKSFVGLGDPERDQWIIDNPNAIKYQPEKAS